VTQFYDVIKITSYLIFLKFYYIIINLKDTNWPNHPATSNHQDAKISKLSNIFTKIVPSRARMTKLDNWEGMIALQ